MKQIPPMDTNTLDDLDTMADMASFLLYTWTGITIIIIMFLAGAIIIAFAGINDSTQRDIPHKTAWIVAQIIGFPLMSIIYIAKSHSENKFANPPGKCEVSTEPPIAIKNRDEDGKRFMPGNGL